MISRNQIPRITLISGTFIWVGLVCGISFLESWLKFQAPGVTVDLGVAIGRLVFSALNKVEIVIAAIVALSWWHVYRGRWKSDASVFILGSTLVILIFQTLVLLPAMDERALQRLSGSVPEPSLLHIYYVGGELIKVFCLGTLGFKSIR